MERLYFFHDLLIAHTQTHLTVNALIANEKLLVPLFPAEEGVYPELRDTFGLFETIIQKYNKSLVSKLMHPDILTQCAFEQAQYLECHLNCELLDQSFYDPDGYSGWLYYSRVAPRHINYNVEPDSLAQKIMSQIFQYECDLGKDIHIETDIRYVPAGWPVVLGEHKATMH